jgi:hypothetical protein
MWENDSCGKAIYMGNECVEKMDNTCTKTMHAGMMDRGFTVSIFNDLQLVHQSLKTYTSVIHSWLFIF